MQPYITNGPARFKGNKWDLLLMTLNYQGQEIDLSGSDSISIFNEQTNAWVKLTENLAEATIKNIFEMSLPVIPIQSLIYYKKILSRDVDLIDIEQIENK